MSSKGEFTVTKYFEKRGLNAIKISEKNTKTPDFKFFKGDNLLFYCEEKTVENDDFIISDGINEVEDKSSTKLSSRINTAIKQFEAENPDHKYPNVLAFNNEDPLVNPNDLFLAITKYTVTDTGKYFKLLNSLGRIEEKLGTIDLYIWFENGDFVNWIWSNQVQEHTARLKSVLNFNLY